MRCPACPDQTLTMSERKGIEIDYCPACRGVWLDRGELDKIIEKSTAEVASVAPIGSGTNTAMPSPQPQYQAPQPQYQAPQPQYRPSYEEQKYADQKYGEKKRKKNFFEELFD